MSETSFSLEILIAKGRNRDAAILLLALMELRLDMRYVALDRSRVQRWLENADAGRKPWLVREQIKAVFVDRGEREAELDSYRQLCMVKHGNPVGGLATLPVVFRPDEIGLVDTHDQPRLAIPHLFAAGCYLRDGFRAAVALGYETYEPLQGVAGDLEKALDRLSHLHDAHVKVLLKEYLEQSSAKPMPNTR
jgi:hypothetical protein